MSDSSPAEDSSIAFPPDIRHFVDEQPWAFAKTMPEWPHEYIVRSNVDEALFVKTVRHIRTHGYDGHFYRKKITYFDEAGLTYWTMGAPVEETTIINRCRKEDTFEMRLLAKTLPP